MAADRIALWVDEEPDALHTYLDDIKECFGPEIEVLAEEPCASLEEMLMRIQSIESLTALVLDERLKETGIANYTGMELTEAVRRMDSKLPVYILTNHATDIGDEDFQVEYVLEKDLFLDPLSRRRMAARVQRQTSRYHDILTDREERYEVLLRKSLTESLSAVEDQEFSDLHFCVGKRVLATEAGTAAKLRQQLEANETILAQIEGELSELGD